MFDPSFLWYDTCGRGTGLSRRVIKMGLCYDVSPVLVYPYILPGTSGTGTRCTKND
jgi:hypothetical protein